VSEDLPLYGPDGGAVALVRVAGGWSWLIVAVGFAIVLLGGVLLT
jgi:hypothetical protein